MKRLPAFAAAILKRFNEKDAAKKKDTNLPECETAAGNEHNEDAAAIDGNDNEPKQDKQLVYAELVLKPPNEPVSTSLPTTTTTTATKAATTAATTTATDAAAAAAATPAAAAKSATEYAEIVYVQKGEGKK